MFLLKVKKKQKKSIEKKEEALKLWKKNKNTKKMWKSIIQDQRFND